MAWTIPTYSGVRATGNPSNYRIAMYELIRAINERHAAQGMVPYIAWITSDGLGSYAPTMEQLEDLPAHGIFSPAYQNMLNIQNYVLGALSPAVEIPPYPVSPYSKYWKPDLSEMWTVDLMESELGMSVTDPPTKYNESRWWQAMQDSLDRMTIIAKDPGITSMYRSADPVVSGWTYSDLYEDGEDAWDARSENNTNIFATPRSVYWQMYSAYHLFGSYPSTYLQWMHSSAMVRNNLYVSPNPTFWHGEIIKSELYFAHSQDGYSGGSFSVSVDGEEFLFSGNASIIREVDSIVVGSDVSIPILITQTEPADSPLTIYATGTNPNPLLPSHTTIGLEVKNYPESYLYQPSGYEPGRGTATCWLDMSSELTDQAEGE